MVLTALFISPAMPPLLLFTQPQGECAVGNLHFALGSRRMLMPQADHSSQQFGLASESDAPALQKAGFLYNQGQSMFGKHSHSSFLSFFTPIPSDVHRVHDEAPLLCPARHRDVLVSSAC